MKNKKKQSKSSKSGIISFGSLGSVSIIETNISSELEVHAKLTSSMMVTCPDGSVVGKSGPSFADDVGCTAPKGLECI